MATVALILCFCFSGWMIWRDRSRHPPMSWALWIPTALLLILGSRSVSLWLNGPGPQGVIAGNDAERSPFDQLFYFTVFASALLVTASRGIRWKRVFTANAALVLFYAFFAVSVLWSGDPTGSIKRLVKDFGQLFVIAILWSEKQPIEAVRSVYIRCACILLPLSVVCDRYFPTIGKAYTIEGEPMFTGVTTQKNTLGEMVLILSLFLIWDLLESHRARLKLRHLWDRYLLLLLGLFLLRDSQSKTALICLLVGAALTLRRGRLASRLVSTMALLSALFLPFVVIFAQEYRSLIAPVVEAVGRNMTFTGRTDIWDHITTDTVNPLIGAGYWNFWGGPGGKAIMVTMKTIVPNAHCGYLDIYLDGGALGLILLGILLIASGRRVIRNTSQSSFDRLRFAILIAAIVYNLSETTFTRLSPSWFATLLATSDFSAATATLRATLHFEREPDLKQERASAYTSLAGTETRWFS